jgi:hypothetical protein
MLLMGRSCLLLHVLAGVVVGRVWDWLTLRDTRLSVSVWILGYIARSYAYNSRLRILKPGRFGLKNNIYAHKLAFSAIDRAPFVDNACNPVLYGSVVPRKLHVLVLDQLVNDPATVWGRNLI